MDIVSHEETGDKSFQWSFLIFKWSYDPLDDPRHVQKAYRWNPLITDAKVSRGWEASHVMEVVDMPLKTLS